MSLTIKFTSKKLDIDIVPICICVLHEYSFLSFFLLVNGERKEEIHIDTASLRHDMEVELESEDVSTLRAPPSTYAYTGRHDHGSLPDLNRNTNSLLVKALKVRWSTKAS